MVTEASTLARPRYPAHVFCLAEVKINIMKHDVPTACAVCISWQAGVTIHVMASALTSVSSHRSTE